MLLKILILKNPMNSNCFLCKVFNRIYKVSVTIFNFHEIF